MCDCLDSPWVRRANTFLTANRNNQDGKWHTVNFLVQYHCGKDKGTPIREILQHLSSNGININREEFQQTILGELKREGIVATLIYPGSKGGVFIPCNEDEVKKVTRQILNRIDSLIENLTGVLQHTSFSNLVSPLARVIYRIRRNI